MSNRTNADPSPVDERRDEAPDDDLLSLSRDDAYHLLQNERRRAVIRYLLSRDGDEFVLRAVAEDIAAWENGTTVEQLGSAERQRVYISLYQSHLPKLDEYGLVEYDQGRGSILLQPLTRVLEPLVDAETGLDASDVIEVPGGSTDGSEDDTGGLLSKLGI